MGLFIHNELKQIFFKFKITKKMGKEIINLLMSFKIHPSVYSFSFYHRGVSV